MLENDDDDAAATKSRRREEKMKIKMKIKEKERKEKNKNKKVKVKKACDHSLSPLQSLHVPSPPVLWPGGRSLELGEISRYVMLFSYFLF